MIMAAALTVAIVVGGVAGGWITDFPRHGDVGDNPSHPSVAMAFTTGGEEDEEAREIDQRSPRLPVAEPYWDSAQWSTVLGSADGTREEGARGSPTPTVVLEVYEQIHSHRRSGVGEIKAYTYERFSQLGLDADYAWEVLRCESDGFNPDVIYGPHTGSYGEMGIGQLKPNGGLLGDFYEQGYQDPWDPFQQLDYMSWKVSREGWWAWTCAS